MTTISTSLTIDDAYTECARITKDQARNFYYGIRLLPADKRAALSAVYAFARRADDVGDNPATALPLKIEQLATLRAQLADLPGGSSDPVLLALDDASRRFPLPLDALSELIDGIEMDVRGVHYETFDDLVIYCQRVAGTVGRLSLAVFGSPPNSGAEALADRLGVALQQTNILRDIREDFTNSRIYVPTEDLERFDVTLRLDASGSLESPGGRLESLVRAGAARAEEWYRDGLRLLDLLDRRSFACCAAMSGIYHRLNRAIARDPAAIRSRRLSLPGPEKAGIALRSLAGRRP